MATTRWLRPEERSPPGAVEQEGKGLEAIAEKGPFGPLFYS
jgi:hypothetical protein